MSEVTPVASRRVAIEWQARVAAEYGSAALTQHFVLWLMRAGAPPDLIDAGLEIVADELTHSRISHEVCVATGLAAPLAIDASLRLPRDHARANEAALISGESSDESLQPEHDGRNLAAWFAGLIAYSPAAYATMDAFLKGVMPDLWDIKNPLLGKETRSLTVQFRHKGETPLQVPLAALSDGEKCFFLCALLLAANEAYGPLFCFWDEPDSHLSLDEVSHFVVALRRAFEASGGQLLMASHNAETIRRFSDDTTLVLYRRSHLEPTRFKPLEDCEIHGDLINALIAGDVDP